MEKEREEKLVCIHCGFENVIVINEWNRVDDSFLKCKNCGEIIISDGDENSNNSHFLKKFIFFTIFLTILVLYLSKQFDTGSRGFWDFAYAFVFIIIVSSVFASFRSLKKFRDLSIWFLIIIASLAVYSYRYELSEVKDRVISELIPSKGVKGSEKSISFKASSNGHFFILAEVNNVPVMFLADTGATEIVLTPKDAEKIGIKISEIKFNKVFQTANGIVKAGKVSIKSLKIGDILLSNLNVYVNGADMGESLLGMSFFGKLKSYQVKNNTLTLFSN